MEVDNNASVVTVSTDDVLDYVRGDSRLPVALGTVMDSIDLEFRPSLSVDPEHDSDYAMVLNASSVQSLVQMGSVRYTLNDHDGHTVVLKMEEDNSDVRHRLKQAFHAHDRDFEGFGGKDVRRVWHAFQEEQYESQ